MGFKDKFVRFVAGCCVFFSLVGCLVACKDPDPSKGQGTPDKPSYSIEYCDDSIETSLNVLKNKFQLSYEDSMYTKGAVWEDTKVLSVYQDKDTYRSLTITAAVPIEDSLYYDYCIITAKHKADRTPEDEEINLPITENLYPCEENGKYYKGDSFASICRYFDADNYDVDMTLVDESYYKMHDELKDAIAKACNVDTIYEENFFDANDVDSYITHINGNELCIYNTITMKKVKLTYSQPFESINKSAPYLIKGEYTDFTLDELKKLGYSFTTLYYIPDKEIKK